MRISSSNLARLTYFFVVRNLFFDFLKVVYKSEHCFNDVICGLTLKYFKLLLVLLENNYDTLECSKNRLLK